MEEFLLPCLNKQLFGIDCLGCGAQRALLLVFQGEFAAAWKMFPAIYSILFLLAFVMTNLFVQFKNAFIIKISLIILSAFIIIAGYIFKMSHFF